ncbi:unnamed protein product [Chondrus crispus]|uniref:Uncharacterized protein n=1 Tax=Chondrus crispus TaxID=2769 RepID=R7QH54_CHOCR|nr:unnamed protein product [Chondrus crispus]CDF36755.1 unnamed protein product [Chondrus crispus]|eukprot:XP_005716574.1 unnamed protein product [Chondrus crispus]
MNRRDAARRAAPVAAQSTPSPQHIHVAQREDLTQPPPSIFPSLYDPEQTPPETHPPVESKKPHPLLSPSPQAPLRRGVESRSHSYHPHGAQVLEEFTTPSSHAPTRQVLAGFAHVDPPCRVGISPDKLPQAILSRALRRLGISSNRRKGVLATRLRTHGIDSPERISTLARKWEEVGCVDVSILGGQISGSHQKSTAEISCPQLDPT